MDREVLRVAFNATPLLSPITGIGNYIIELGAALAASGTVDPYSFYRYKWRHEAPTPPAEAPPGTRELANRIKPLIPMRGPMRRAAHYLGFSSGLKRNRVQLYHEPNYIPLSYDVPTVITIHDLSWMRFPEAHPADRVRWLDRTLPEAIDRSQAILVDSDFIRHEVLTTFGIDTERVTTVHLGVSPVFHPRAADVTGSVLARFGLSHGSYILTVGTLEPRKNLRHMLESYALLPASFRERFPLVIAGARGWRSSGLVTQLRRIGDRQVRFLGHVDPTVLPHLYAGAALFAFPSLYEGFGLPPLEAMASGVPVVVSDRASLPEVVGNAGATMNPGDPEQTAHLLGDLLDDVGMRAAMTRRGLERASRFTWRECAVATRDVYRVALLRASTHAESEMQCA
ncbi:MAG TPA: glycosyltransferase family 1 protein [Casimicrobiaceae bacterium]|nr:glycosyltransferase family 1 protein [Casimicrobiaceae bacterium]